MDRNSIAGLLLIGLILIGFSIWNQPSTDELAAQQKQKDSIEAIAKNEAEIQKKLQPASKQITSFTDTLANDTSSFADSTRQILRENEFGAFADAVVGKEQFFTLENDVIKATFTNKGGRVHSVELKNYKTFDQKPLTLFDSDSTVFGLNFFAQNRNISTDKLFFEPIPAGRNKISFKLKATGSGFIEYAYSLPATGYMLDFDINLSGMEQVVASNINYLELDWRQNIYKKEKSVEAERINSTIYYKYPDEHANYLSETEDDEEKLATTVKWVAFKQQYFNTTLIAKNNFDKPTKISTIHHEGKDSLAKSMQASLTIPYSHKPFESFEMSFYFGPNHYQTLKQFDIGMEKLVPLGWGIFGWVNMFIVIPIFNFLNKFDLNYGIIILILTIVIKLMLLPFTYKAYLSTAKMKVLKPEMDEIQAKHKEDPMKSQQELLAMYKKAGVNPLGGCLPMVLQMPILIAMFRFFPASIELRQESFLWADDLSTYDSILNLPFNIPFYGDHVSLFTILMTISTLMYTYLNSQMTAANPQMKWVMYLMPVMFLGIFNNYSAGLSYYYFLANMISFGQQFLFRAAVDEKAIHAKIQENKKRPQAATKSKFQQRLEQMAKDRGINPKK
ncbi:MAG: membrane protein insertase YidC [Bacteroidetes bacterium]|nr:membrane protein insertase YidC [Bacteroidota bacterium]